MHPDGLPDGGKGEGHDGNLHRQRIFFECLDGLPSGAFRRTSGGNSSPAGPVSVGSAGGRSLCGGGLSAGAGIFGGGAGKAGGRRAPFSDGLRRRGAVFPIDAAAVFRRLCHGRLCTGPGTGNREPDSGGKGHLLYGYQRRNSAGGRRRRLSGIDGGLSCGGEARTAGRAGFGPGLHFRKDSGADCAFGYRKRVAGAFQRAAGPGNSPGNPECPAAPGSSGDADTGETVLAGRSAGTAVADIAGAAAKASAVPGGGNRPGAAAGCPHGLDGNCRTAFSRPDGRAVAHGFGERIHGPLGR